MPRAPKTPKAPKVPKVPRPPKLTASQRLAFRNARTKVISSPQHVMSCLLQDVAGIPIPSRANFEQRYNPPEKGQVPSLAYSCLKFFIQNGDLSEYTEAFGAIVQGQNLSEFSNFNFRFPPELIKYFCIHTEIATNKVRFVIRKDDFYVHVGRYPLITFPFTEDMMEPATQLADYTKIFFDHKKYDIEYWFEDKRNPLERAMELSPKHILLLSKLRPEYFAERALEPKKRERNGRLIVRMNQVSFQSSVYYNCILRFFDKFRAGLVHIGLASLYEDERSFEEILELTLANPGEFIGPPRGIKWRNNELSRRMMAKAGWDKQGRFS